MKLRLIDLFWLVTVAACLTGWYADRSRQAKQLERAIELMRIYKNSCITNDLIYRRNAAELDRQHRALRAMANELERRLEAKP